jgi:hypothetical protein
MNRLYFLAILCLACTVRVYVRATQPVKVDTVIVHDSPWREWPRGDIDPGINPWWPETLNTNTPDSSWRPWLR